MSRLHLPSSSDDDARLIARLKVTGPETYLLAALVLLLVVYPMVEKGLAWQMVVGVLNTAILIAGAFASSRTRGTLAAAFAIALPATVMHWYMMLHYSPVVGLALCVTMIAFYLFAIAHVLASVLRPGPVTGAKLHGAVAAYLMLGFLWAFIYLAIEHLIPGSFDFLGKVGRVQELDWREFVFFSFTTLTTTGYGDISPLSGRAQSAAVLEQLAGTFYVAILVARLTGLYQRDSSRH